MPAAYQTAFDRDFGEELQADLIGIDFIEGEVMENNRAKAKRIYDSDGSPDPLGSMLLTKIKGKAIRRAANGDVDGVIRQRDRFLNRIREVDNGVDGLDSILCEARKKKIEQLQASMETAQSRHKDAIEVQNANHLIATRELAQQYNAEVDAANKESKRLADKLKSSDELVQRVEKERNSSNEIKKTLSTRLRTALLDVNKARNELHEGRASIQAKLNKVSYDNNIKLDNLQNEHRRISSEQADALKRLQEEIKNVSKASDKFKGDLLLAQESNDSLKEQTGIAEKNHATIIAMSNDRTAYTKKQLARREVENSNLLIDCFAIGRKLESVSLRGCIIREDSKQHENAMLDEIHGLLLDLARTRRERDESIQKEQRHRQEMETTKQDLSIYRAQCARHKNRLGSRTKDLEQEKNLRNTTEVDLQQEKSLRNNIEANLEQERSLRNNTEANLEQERSLRNRTEVDLQQERSLHNNTEANLEQERSLHSTTHTSLGREKELHNSTQGKLNKELSSHKVTRHDLATRTRELSKERDDHTSTKLTAIARKVALSTETASHVGTRGQLREVTKQLRSADGKFAKEQTAHTATRATLAATSLDLASERLSHTNTTASLSVHKSKLHESNKEVIDLTNSRDAEVNSHKATKDDLRTAQDTVRSERIGREKDRGVHIRALRIKDITIAVNNFTHRSLQAESREACRVLQGKVHELEVKCDELKRTGGESQRDNTQLEGELTTARTELDVIKKELAYTQLIKSTQAKELEDMGRKLEDTRKRLESADSLSQNQAKELAYTQLIKSTQAKELEDMGRKLEDTRKKLESADSLSQNQAKELEDMGRKLEDTRKKLESADSLSQNQAKELEDMGRKLEDTRKRLESADSLNQNQAKVHTDLEHVHRQALVKTQNQTESITKLQHEIVRLMTVEEHIAKTGEHSKTALQAARASLLDTQDQLAAANGQAQGYRNALMVQAGQQASTIHRLDNVRLQRDAAVADSAKANAKWRLSDEQAESLHSQIHHLERARTGQQDEIDQLLQSMAEARQQKSVDDQELKKLEGKFARSQKWLARTCKSLDDVQKQLEGELKRKSQQSHESARGKKQRK